jgi:putative transposase
VSEISCSRQTSFTVLSPRRPASTISIFCCAVQLRYLRCSLNPVSLSVKRPILSRTPDSPSGATRLRDSPALPPTYLSTPDRGAGQSGSKELEIVVLRHELSILRRQAKRPQLRQADRVLLAALSRVLPRRSWSVFLVSPRTLLRWHQRLVARRWTYPRGRIGRPQVGNEVEQFVVRFARENPSWGYKRIAGELLGLGVAVSPSSVRAILIRHGLPPAPERDVLSWRRFLHQQAASMLACDFLTVETILLTRIYVLFFVSLERRRVAFVASTTNPDGRWVAQQARNLVMQLGDTERRFRFLLHDRDSKFCFDFDAVFRSEGMRIIRTP